MRTSNPVLHLIPMLFHVDFSSVIDNLSVCLKRLVLLGVYIFREENDANVLLDANFVRLRRSLVDNVHGHHLYILRHPSHLS